MNDSTYTLLLTVACGLGLLCLVGLGIGLAVVSGAMGAGLRLFSRGSAPTAPRPAAPRRERADLRAKAESVDFDAALARHSAQDAPPGPPPLPGPPPGPPDLGPLPPASAHRRARPAPRAGDDYSDDEIFGGILDDDGDGYPDL